MSEPAVEPESPAEPGSAGEAAPAVEPASAAEAASAVEPASAAGPAAETPSTRNPRAAQGETPLYKGEPLEAERGPGLGCFWVQIVLLGILLVLTPLTVLWAWDERISAVLLLVTLGLLLFAGQTVIFLLRLVAADRRSRRVPRAASARRTVGMLEDEAPVPTSAEDASTDQPDP